MTRPQDAATEALVKLDTILAKLDAIIADTGELRREIRKPVYDMAVFFFVVALSIIGFAFYETYRLRSGL